MTVTTGDKRHLSDNRKTEVANEQSALVCGVPASVPTAEWGVLTLDTRFPQRVHHPGPQIAAAAAVHSMQVWAYLL